MLYLQPVYINHGSILDVDASGEVDALTDGLLLLRSMFGLTDSALANGVVSPTAAVGEPEAIDSYIKSWNMSSVDIINDQEMLSNFD